MKEASIGEDPNAETVRGLHSETDGSMSAIDVSWHVFEIQGTKIKIIIKNKCLLPEALLTS